MDAANLKEALSSSMKKMIEYKKKELPFVLDKMTKLHKSQSKDTLSPLNTFFGISLFFFVISSFFEE